MELESFTHEINRTLRARALSYPDVSEGTSCVNRAFKVRKKNFAFLGEKGDRIRLMAKLSPAAAESLPDDPRVSLGKFGWITVEMPATDPFSADVLFRWIDESYRNLAPKSLVKSLSSD